MPSVLIATAELHTLALVEHALADLAAVDVEHQSAADVAATLAVVRDQRPDVVIADGGLPGDGGGVGVCRTVKVDLGLDTVTVVVLVADEPQRAEAIGAGADLALVAPFDPDALLDVTRRALELEDRGGSADGHHTGAVDLAWLIRHDRHLAPVLSVVLGGIDAAIRISDPDGTVLVERTGPGGDGEHHAVRSGGRTLGTVEGDRFARAIAAILSYAADREAERRSLASEALAGYRALNARTPASAARGPD